MADTKQAAKPGFLSRMGQALVRPLANAVAKQVTNTIAGVDSNTWMGPSQPLAPMAPPSAKGRGFDYLFGWNLQYIPRATEPVTFERLKSLAEYGIPRLVIESRKDQLAGMEYTVRPKEKRTPDGTKVRPKGSLYKGKIEEITSFLESPDGRLDWQQWQREILEQNLVYDAVAVYRRKTRGGQLHSLNIIDGATISVKLDADGRTPQPPSVAYQQIIKGLPASNYDTFTTGDMMYYPENPRVDRGYGHSRVAQVINYIDMCIARVRMQTSYFSEGNMPDGLIEAPIAMTPSQIEEMQTYWDGMLSGNVEQRRRALWVPSGTKFNATKDSPFMDEFDEWLARIICYAFSISPAPFVKMMNRATSDSQREQASDEGLRPTMSYMQRLMTRFINYDFDAPDLEFAYNQDLEFDPAKKAVMDNTYGRMGAKKLNEIREELGLEPVPGAGDQLMYATPTGWVPIDPQERTDMGTPTPGGVDPLDLQAAKPAPVMHPGFGAGGQGKAPSGEPGAGSNAPGGGQSGTQKAISAPPSPIYVARPLLNAHQVRAWAQEQGFADVLPGDDMRTVVGHWPEPVSLSTYAGEASAAVMSDNGPRSIGIEDGHAVLYFQSPDLNARWGEFATLTPAPSFVEGGNLPYVRFARAAVLPEHLDEVMKGDVRTYEPRAVKAYDGMLLFGEERVSKSAEEWRQSLDLLTFVEKLSREEVDVHAARADTNATAAQHSAGNYRMGHVRIQGMDISIETPAGAKRTGVYEGKTWSVTMPTHYGYIKRTKGADGDHVDVYIGPNPDSKMVWVVDQHDADSGSFDEHKAMLGYDRWADAQSDYLAAFSDGRGHERLGGVTAMSVDEFKAWLTDGDTTRSVSRKTVTVGTGLHGHDLRGAAPPQDRPPDGNTIAVHRDPNVRKGKKGKKEVDYSPGKPEAHCGICEHFVPDQVNDEIGACQLVRGEIDPQMWCKLFEKTQEVGKGSRRPFDHGAVSKGSDDQPRDEDGRWTSGGSQVSVDHVGGATAYTLSDKASALAGDSRWKWDNQLLVTADGQRLGGFSKTNASDTATAGEMNTLFKEYSLDAKAYQVGRAGVVVMSAKGQERGDAGEFSSAARTYLSMGAAYLSDHEERVIGHFLGFTKESTDAYLERKRQWNKTVVSKGSEDELGLYDSDFKYIDPGVAKGSDDQLRDDHGRWTSGGGDHSISVYGGSKVLGAAAHEALSTMPEQFVKDSGTGSVQFEAKDANSRWLDSAGYVTYGSSVVHLRDDLKPREVGTILSHEMGHLYAFNHSDLQIGKSVRADKEAMSAKDRKKYDYFLNKTEATAEAISHLVLPRDDSASFAKVFPATMARVRGYLQSKGSLGKLVKGSDDQPRDQQGRWTSGGGGVAPPAAVTKALENKLIAQYAPMPTRVLRIDQLKSDPDAKLILKEGKLTSGRNAEYLKGGRSGECHWNAAKAFNEGKVDAIGIGYALNHDWMQHTWGVKDGKVVELTPANKESTGYFGVTLTKKESTAFAKWAMAHPPGGGVVRHV